MQNQDGSQQTQMMMEQGGKSGMGMSMTGCHTTMYVFGLIVIVALLIQVVLQAKMLTELRRTSKK